MQPVRRLERETVRAMKLEINPVEHCNLACESCSHLSPIQPRYAVEPDALERDLAILGRCYHARWVRLVGGEPLLHPNLASLIDAIRSTGISDQVMLVTNGVLLPRMHEDVWRRLDRIDVSQYPDKTLSEEERAGCASTARSHGVRVHFDTTLTFRAAYSEVGTASEDLVEKIYRSCAIAHDWRCHTLARGVFYRCPQSYFLSRSISALSSVNDGVPVIDDLSFPVRLRALLQREEPLHACGHCLGTAGARFPHRQIRRDSFREPQRLPTEMLLDPTQISRLTVARRPILGCGPASIRSRHKVNRHLRRPFEAISPQLYARLYWLYQHAHGQNRELLAVKQLLQHNAQIIDIGASSGRYSLYFRHHTGPDALIYMFEPGPHDRRRLEALARRYDNLRFHPVALSSRSGTGTLYVPVRNGVPIPPRASLQPPAQADPRNYTLTRVELARLDDVPDLDNVQLVKCDVEGHELEVLRGSVQTLQRTRPVVLIEIEERHAGRSVELTFDLMSSIGYTGFYFCSGIAYPLSTFDLDRHQRRYLNHRHHAQMPAEYVRDFLFVPLGK